MLHADMVRDTKERLEDNRVDTSGQEKAEAIWEVLNKYQSMPFGWDGTSDCCALAGDLVKAIHGHDYMSEFQYANKAEALRAIREHGTLVDAITSVMGNPRPACLVELKTGDVLIAEQEDGTWIPGIYLMGRMVVRSKSGIMDWPVEFAVHMWRPGECHKL